MSNAEKKYFCEYDSGVEIEDLAEQILNDPDLPQLKSIIIGMWHEEVFDEPAMPIFEMIVKNKEKFQHIESFFVGDMEAEECEISWIQQCNYEDFLNALPNLKSLKIKGSTGLVLGKINHQNLESLEIMCGGLPLSVVDSLKTASLPNLKSLTLYLGEENYGYDCKVSDFANLTKKSLFPKLKTLGLLNATEQDEIVGVILESDILPQLENIDISCGCLTDKGGQLILDDASKLSHIKKLKIVYHYLSDEMVEKLESLPFEVEIDDQQEADEPDEYWTGMYPMITE